MVVQVACKYMEMYVPNLRSGRVVIQSNSGYVSVRSTVCMQDTMEG